MGGELLSADYLWDVFVALVAFLNVFILVGERRTPKSLQEISDPARVQNSLYMLNDTAPPAGVILSNLGLYLISLHPFASKENMLASDLNARRRYELTRALQVASNVTIKHWGFCSPSGLSAFIFSCLSHGSSIRKSSLESQRFTPPDPMYVFFSSNDESNFARPRRRSRLTAMGGLKQCCHLFTIH